MKNYKFYGYSDRIHFFLIFSVASAWFFSNLKVGTIPLGNLITILSILASLFLVKIIDLLIVIGLSVLVLISSIAGIYNENYFIGFIYKIGSFIPVVVIVRGAQIKIIYKAVLASFVLSTCIAIFILLIGYSEPKFIIYQDVIPRFAGLAIEPSSYAIGTVVLYLLYIIYYGKVDLKNKLYFYIPILSAVSSVIIFKIIIDYLDKIKMRHAVLFMPFLFVIFLMLFTQTRAGESIEMRLFLYEGILNYTDFQFFGSGFYAHEDAKGLPGLLRIFFELGIIFMIFLFLTYIYNIFKYRLYRWPFLIVGMILPLVTEAYGAPLLWLISSFCLFRARDALLHVKSPTI